MKMIGVLLFFSAAVMLGLTAGKKERARTAECYAFLEFFSYIENQIGYFFAPTKHIYQTVQNDVLERVGFLEALRSHEEDEVYFDVWTASLENCKDRLHLTSEQYEIVRSFGSCIGKSNEEWQMKTLAYYQEALASEAEKQKAEMKKNIKVYRTLGLAVGMAAVLLAL